MNPIGATWAPVPPQILIAAAGLAMAGGPLALELIFMRGGSEQAWLLLLHSIPYGLGLGGHAVAIPVLVGRCFGELHFAPTMGLIQTGFAVGVMVGIPVSGAVFDRAGSYEPVLVACVLALVTSALLAWRIDPDQHRGEFAEA